MITTARNIAIGIAIAILLPLATHVSTQLVMHEPKSPKFNMAKTAAAHEENEAARVLNRQEHKEFEKIDFIISVSAGLIALTLGILALPTPQLSIGFIFGGTLCLITGYMGHWGDLSATFKFASLLIALIILILGGLNWQRRKGSR